MISYPSKTSYNASDVEYSVYWRRAECVVYPSVYPPGCALSQVRIQVLFGHLFRLVMPFLQFLRLNPALLIFWDFPPGHPSSDSLLHQPTREQHSKTPPTISIENSWTGLLQRNASKEQLWTTCSFERCLHLIINRDQFIFDNQPGSIVQMIIIASKDPCWQ